MEIKFISKIYRCRPILDINNGLDTSEFEEELIDTKVFTLSDLRCDLEDVHTYVCSGVRNFRNLYPSGRYRVNTNQSRVKVSRSSYLFV